MTTDAEPWPDEAWRYPKHVRFFTRGFDVLPYPIGVECLAIGRGLSMVPGRHGQRARAWAAHHRASKAAQWKLAFDVLAHRVRFHAISALVGARHPDVLRPGIEVHGEEHLTRAHADGATLLINFHIGPPGTFLALRLRGPRLLFVGLLDVSGRWDRPAWAPYLDPAETLSIDRGDITSGTRALQRARQRLGDGGIALMMADGPVGHELCRVPVRGADIILRRGWFALRRMTGATTLPVLSHWQRHRRVIEIGPPLPPPCDDAERDMSECRASLTPFLTDYVDRHPEQCPLLALWKDGRPT